MNSFLTAVLLVLLTCTAEAQSTQSILPYKPTQIDAPQPAMPNLHLEDWNKVTSPGTPSPGITLFSFDYTKFLQWLIPKKHPKIPPECDPKNFLNDSIPPAPMIKEDSVRGTKPPV
jgi:hypothetical protein